MLLLFCLAYLVFLYTVQVRRPWYGQFSYGNHQWLSGTTLKFAKNWYNEGPSVLRFRMLEHPRSIEFPTLESRFAYVSYPPGAVVPFYLTMRLTGREPTTRRLMRFNLLNHLAITLLLVSICYTVLRGAGVGRGTAALWTTVPIGVELLTPAPMYWHQNVYFADQAVIVLFVGLIFFEVLRMRRWGGGAAKLLALGQALVLFLGILTDWLFVFASAAVYAKRAIFGELGSAAGEVVRRSIWYWLPAGVALALYAYQVFDAGAWDRLVGIAMFRTALTGYGAEFAQNFHKVFWWDHVRHGFGGAGVMLLWGSVAVWLGAVGYAIRRRWGNRPADGTAVQVLAVIGLVLIPCFLQVYVLRNHSAIHSFSALKFSIPLATVPFVLLPLAVDLLTGAKLLRRRAVVLGTSRDATMTAVRIPMIAFVAVTAAAIYVASLHSRLTALFPNPDPEIGAIGGLIRRHTEFKDVVFSPNFEIASQPPQRLAESMKMVYRVDSLDAIRRKLRPLDRQRLDYRIMLFVLRDGAAPDRGLQTLMQAGDVVYEDGAYRLLRLEPARFRAVLREAKRSSAMREGTD